MCGGIGYLRRDVPIDHPDFGKPIPCECRRTELASRRLDTLKGISNLNLLTRLMFETFRLDVLGLNYVKQKNLNNAYRDAREFAEKPKGWLLISGGYGCGKTHLAVAIAHYVVNQGNPAFFVLVPDLLDHLRATYNPQATVSYDQRFDEIRQAPLLILDDLGAHSSTAWAQEKLFQLFNARYNARLPTVVTTNLELEDLDLRLRSRLSDIDLVRHISISAPDYRQSGVSSDHSDLSTLSLHTDKTFDEFDLRRHELSPEQSAHLQTILEKAFRFAQGPEGWLIFSGDYGCGKTHLAAAIANYRQKELVETSLFITVPDLLDHLRASFSPNSTVSYDKRFDEVRKTPLLVLDDLGTESATPWAQEKLYQLFNYRYNAKLPTVITMATYSNVHPRLKSMLYGRWSTVFEITTPAYHNKSATPPSNVQKPPTTAKPTSQYSRTQYRPNLGSYRSKS